MEFSVESFEKIGESLAMLGDERLAPAFLSHANHDSKSTKLTNVYILSGIELGTDGVAELNLSKIERIPPPH